MLRSLVIFLSICVVCVCAFANLHVQFFLTAVSLLLLYVCLPSMRSFEFQFLQDHDKTHTFELMFFILRTLVALSFVSAFIGITKIILRMFLSSSLMLLSFFSFHLAKLANAAALLPVFPAPCQTRWHYGKILLRA